MFRGIPCIFFFAHALISDLMVAAPLSLFTLDIT